MGGIESSFNLTTSESSDQIYQLSHDVDNNFICFGIILPIIVLFGLIGNILTIMVLCQKDIRSNLMIYLRAIIVTDNIILIFSFISLTPESISDYTGQLKDFRYFVFPVIFTTCSFLLMVSEMINVWCTVCISIERYLNVCHSSISKRLFTGRKALIIIWAITVVSILYNLPRVFATESIKSHSREGYFLLRTSYGSSHLYLEVYSRFLYSVFLYILPLSVLFVFNIFLILNLKRIRHLYTEMSLEEKESVDITLLTVVLIVIFFVCNAPVIVLELFDISHSKKEKLLSASNILGILNSAVKILAFITIVHRFRIMLQRKFKWIQEKIVGIKRQDEVENLHIQTDMNDDQEKNDPSNRIKSFPTTDPSVTDDI